MKRNRKSWISVTSIMVIMMLSLGATGIVTFAQQQRTPGQRPGAGQVAGTPALGYPYFDETIIQSTAERLGVGSDQLNRALLEARAELLAPTLGVSAQQLADALVNIQDEVAAQLAAGGFQGQGGFGGGFGNVIFFSLLSMGPNNVVIGALSTQLGINGQQIGLALWNTQKQEILDAILQHDLTRATAGKLGVSTEDLAGAFVNAWEATMIQAATTPRPTFGQGQ